MGLIRGKLLAMYIRKYLEPVENDENEASVDNDQALILNRLRSIRNVYNEIDTLFYQNYKKISL